MGGDKPSEFCLFFAHFYLAAVPLSCVLRLLGVNFEGSGPKNEGRRIWV